jgi:hypothetical protein
MLSLQGMLQLAVGFAALFAEGFACGQVYPTVNWTGGQGFDLTGTLPRTCRLGSSAQAPDANLLQKRLSEVPGFVLTF